MDNLRKIRAPLRAAFTSESNLLKTEIENDPMDKAKIEVLYAVLEETAGELETADHNIQEAMIQDDVPEDDYMRECEDIRDYKKQFIALRVQVNAIFRDPAPSVYADAMSVGSSKKKFRLPKLELQKFGGDLKDWLGFWSLFKKIHEDSDVDAEDKFQYLLQAITPGTRARELIDSYPPTAENYPKVVESLQQRFGRDELLVEVYVRELLRLVLHNATNPKEKVQVTKLYDQLESHIRALDTLGVTSDKCAVMLYPIVESCLPEDVMRVWQRSPQNSTVNADTATDHSKNRLTKVLDFLRAEVEREERIRLARTGFGLPSKREKNSKEQEIKDNVPTAAGLFNNENQSGAKAQLCIFCEKRHLSQECFTAQKLSLQEKNTCVKKRKCCFACLKGGHSSKDCKSFVKCVLCGKKHYALMCPGLPHNQESSSKNETGGVTTKPAFANLSNTPEVLLKTLNVNINIGGQTRQARVVIDDGSHRSYILKNIAQTMKLKPIGKEPMIHALFGGVKSDPVEHTRYEVPLSKLDGSYSCKLKMLDQVAICAAIPKVPRGPWLGELQERKIWISDVGSGCPEVEILIGADFAGSLMTGKVRHLKSGLVAVETKLGWTLMGEVPRPRRDTSALIVTSLMNSDAAITNLWQLEAIGITDPGDSNSRKDLEMAAKDHFQKTVRINSDGRYEVHLPWLEGHPKLGTNKNVAEKRLVTATNKLKATERYQDYDNVFKEWLEAGIIEKVPEISHTPEHYLPHRAVFKENSLTTKVRPVFDASAHEKGYPSLNDCLEKGPNLVEEILVLLIKFREKRIGVVSDIAKAFLQLSLYERDRDFLRFLWWEDSDQKKMIVYRHRRVVFGVSSSPFLLAAVLEHHLDNAPPRQKNTAEILKKSFYVDNCVACVNDKQELEEFIFESTQLLKLGKFDLRGWEYTNGEENGGGAHEVEVPVLGLMWNKLQDTLSCDMSKFKLAEDPVSKRKILSVAHQVFDPMGIMCPVTLLPKKLLQSTWEVKAGWDAKLPEEITEKFKKWANELHLLGEIKIPRWITCVFSAKETWSLHIFSDASKTAYAACVFIRAETRRGIMVQLVLAKSRVAPMKSITIPRLELLSCVIGTRLASMVKTSLELQTNLCYHWTDSSTALSWIQRDDQWGTFVGNRVKEIRTFTNPQQWRHVPGHMNPADLPSRGCSARYLLESRWWEGPQWLRQPENEWPKSNIITDDAEVNRERRKTVSSLLVTNTGWESISKYFEDINVYSKLVRRVAWLSRFVRWTWDKKCIQGNLLVQEIQSAEDKLMKAVQREAFQNTPQNFMKGAMVVLHEDGLHRVKTRLTLSDESEGFMFPVLLPGNHPVTAMLIEEQHQIHSHAGIQELLSVLREKYWIVRGRRSIRSILKRCVRCRRFEARCLEATPGPLPKDRIRDAAVFEIVGVDLAGPLYLKGGSKVWIVLYTCAVYRAVHFELVTSLSTERFIMSFRRFIGRRGRPSIVYSDNGTNFVGTDNLFRAIDWKLVESFSSCRRIQWRFNPPTAAWWGGWWERIVRMLKCHLRRVLGKASMDFEELHTVIADVEAIVNSRPLTYVSENMEDLVPISPSLFLKENREDGVPEMDLVDHEALNKRWKRRQQLRDDLRKRFRSEYLSQLVQRPGFEKRSVRPPVVGEIVLVGSDNHKRIDWPLAKVLEMIPGRDGNSRVVRLKTAVGELIRPIQRVYPLEISNLEMVNAEVMPATEVLDEEIKCPVKIIKTRYGREVKAPVKFVATHVSLFSYSY